VVTSQPAASDGARQYQQIHQRKELVMIYKGSCHCGQVAFEVDGELTQVADCNCSICSRKASLLWFVPRDKLRLLTPEENLNTYTFNKHVIEHRFCPRCGIHPFGQAVSPSGEPMAAINVRCLEDVDIASLPVHHYDGRSF
jgi:hypothetical protein